MHERLLHIKQSEEAVKAEIAELQGQRISEKFQLNKLEQENELLRKQNDWLSGELDRKTVEFQEYRKEKSSSLLQLRSSLDEKTQLATVQQETIIDLKKRNQELTVQLESYMERLRESSDKIITMQEEFKQEMNTQTKLANLYKASAEENGQRLNVLESAFSELQSVVDAKNAELVRLRSHIDSEKASVEAALNAREQELEKLRTELQDANDAIGLSSGMGRLADPSQSLLLSPTAAAAQRLQKSGKSFTEVVRGGQVYMLKV